MNVTKVSTVTVHSVGGIDSDSPWHLDMLRLAQNGGGPGFWGLGEKRPCRCRSNREA